MSEISDTNQLVRKHRTKNFSCAIVFIIYVLRLNALFNENSVEDTRTVRESFFNSIKHFKVSVGQRHVQ